MDFSIKLIFLIYLFGNSVAFNYDNFEGYLKRLDTNEEESVDNYDNNRVKIGRYGMDTEEEEYRSDLKKALKQMPTPLSLSYVRESMDRDTACCMLGQIAGDKGYHCHISFYSYDILQRNTNRAHNKKLSFYGRDRMPHFGEKLMIRFEKCLSKKGFIFNKCCNLAAKERQNYMSPQYNTLQHYLYNLHQNTKLEN